MVNDDDDGIISPKSRNGREPERKDMSGRDIVSDEKVY